MTDRVTPLAFRNLPIIEVRKKETTGNAAAVTSTTVPVEKKSGSKEATLIIETSKNDIAPASAPQVLPKKDPAAEQVKFPSTKIGALSKIREQYSRTNGAETIITVKPLNQEELQNCWHNYTDILREAKNPAAQSFDRASFNITNNNLFDVVTNNNLELKFVEQQRLRLIDHLQAWFNNKALSYSLLIKEKSNVTEKYDAPLNSRDQFQKLAEQYPLVKELKDRLKLELDY